MMLGQFTTDPVLRFLQQFDYFFGRFEHGLLRIAVPDHGRILHNSAGGKFSAWRILDYPPEVGFAVEPDGAAIWSR